MPAQRPTKQSGFSIVEVSLIVFVVATLTVTGLVVYQRHKSTNTKSNAATSPNQTPAQSQNTVAQSAQTDPYDGWQTYTSNDGEFSVKYPPTWHQGTASEGQPVPILISPTNTVLHVYSDNGGKGGGPCVPRPSDVPFQKGNACTTFEYLTAEKLSVDNLYYMDEVPNVDPVKYVPKLAPVYLVTTHHAVPSGVSSYGISVAETTTPEDTFTVNTPYMGSNPPYTWLTVYNAQGKGYPYIYIYANGDSPSFLTSEDAATIKSIIRSFRLNV